MSRYFPQTIAQLIGEYAAQWMVQPWILQRAPPLTAYRDECNRMLHWHGELVGEDDNELGEGITDTGGKRTSEGWDSSDIKEEADIDDEEDDIRDDIGPDGDPYTFDADDYLWENPHAEDFVRGLEVDWNSLAANPADWALDLFEQLKTNRIFYPWHNMYRNTNPRVLAIWSRWEAINPKCVDWFWLCTNPLGIDKIRATWRDDSGDVDPSAILWNPAAQDFIEKEYKVDIANYNICYNQHPWPSAQREQEKIPIEKALYFGFGRNPNGWAIERMRNYEGVWTPRMLGYLCTNPNPEALAMMRDEPVRFPLRPVIWSNPNIFELVVPPGLVDIIISIWW
jgi:hypothetical protein